MYLAQCNFGVPGPSSCRPGTARRVCAWAISDRKGTLMPSKYSSAFVVAGLLASGALFAQDIARPVPDSATRVVVVQGTPSPAMQKLMDTADKLQASIHELANRPAG